MYVKDIKQDIKDILGFCDDTTVYNRITHAVEALANKGAWDSMIGYLDILVASGNTIALPNFVETPIKININNNPSFSRGQLYEFSLSGPGNDMAETAGYSWLNKLEVPVTLQPTIPSFIIFDSDDTDDNGKFWQVEGIDENGQLVKERIAFNDASPSHTTNLFAKIERVMMDAHVGTITISTTVQSTDLLSVYQPEETEPLYRQIVLSKAAAAVRILYRRRTFEIKSDNDFIPLQSKMAIILMVFALEAYRKGADFAKAKSYEDQSLMFLQAEQQSRNNFDLVQTTEAQPTRDLNYNNADSIIVADIFDDAVLTFGMNSRQFTLDRITDAIELLNNKAHWDGLVGYVDITTDNTNYFTLPRFVEAIVALNVNGNPKIMRNKWYEFHLNGAGSHSHSLRHWDAIGTTVLQRAVSTPVQLTAVPDLSADYGKFVTIYGWDDTGKELGSVISGAWVAGLKLTMGASPTPSVTKVARFERIIKDKTQGYVKLLAGTTQLGFYHPDETEPNYQRIKISQPTAWVRMRYRKRSLKINSLTEPIHLKSKLAIITAMQCIKAMRMGDMKNAEAYETKATDYLTQEQRTSNPGEHYDFQFDLSPANRCVII